MGMRRCDVRKRRWEEQAYFDDTLRVLDHLHLGDVVCPCLVSEQCGNFATKFEEFVHDRYVVSQTGLVALERPFTGLWDLSEFELEGKDMIW